jgi:chemotaxis protein methyltransferase CheR
MTMGTLSLSPQVFAILSALIEERTGLHYAPHDRDLLAQKVSARAVETGFDSLLDYYYLLRYDDPDGREMAALVETLVVHETYFFRELEPLDVLVAHVVAPAVARQGRARVWSAACATGEEPLTLAMLLAERGLLDQVEIVASDISARALDRARAGQFGLRATRQLPDREAARWITEDERGVRVHERIARAVDWRRVNLLDAPQVAALGRFDAILCRNVLFYFSDETHARVGEHLAGALAPGGALLLGVSESLLRVGTALTCEEVAGVFLYRKADP